MKKITLFILFNVCSISAQVGIGTTTPTGALDLNPTIATNYGLVAPRVALTSIIVQAPVVNPQGGAIGIGTVIYNTATAGSSPNNVGPGLYYWDGAKWIAFAGSPGGLDWSLTGNGGTIATTNFVGTTDASDFVVRSNNLERMRVLSGGHVLINQTTNNATTGANNIFEVLATTVGDDAINGYSNGGMGVAGYSTLTGIGVRGENSGTGTGVRGVAFGATGYAISALNTDILGPAIVASGGNVSNTYFTGSGVNGNGTETGVAGIAKTVATGVGLRGNGNGVTSSITSGVGAGVAGSGTQVGVFGHANNITGSKNGGVFTSEHGVAGTGDNPYAYLAGSDGTLVYGGYFDANQDNINNNTSNNIGEDYAYVGVVSGNTTYKILGNGSVSTIVKDENNERRILFAPEAPEILFQDYGVGQLKNGVAIITIDPILRRNIFVDNTHPLKVFIQLEGDCNGVYVTSKSANGFTVKELKEGKSNTSFSWQLIANRADTIDPNGKVQSKHVNVRFPIGPGPIKHRDLHSEKSMEKSMEK